MSKAFEEWWDEEPNLPRVDPEYGLAKAAWNAAMLHAAEVAEDEAQQEASSADYFYNMAVGNIATRLRQEVGNE